MYKKVQPQGNIMIRVSKCIGVSTICIPKNPGSNFYNCSVNLPRSEICHNMRKASEVFYFFPYRMLLIDTSRLRLPFYFSIPWFICDLIHTGNKVRCQ